jgi:DHA1 family multidrug resistance protein-like MFS transporter
MLLIFVVSFGMSAFQGILGLYALQKFNFDTTQIGAIWMMLGALMIISQGVLTGLLTSRFGEAWVIRVSLLATAAGFGLILLAGSFLPLLLAVGFLILAIALLGPALNALISTRTTLQQGITMGVNNSFSSLGKVVGPLWAGFLFDIHINLPFLSSAVILLLGFVISLVVALQVPREQAPAHP